MSSLNIATWNILFDHRPGSPFTPQSERYESIAAKLLEMKDGLDVVCLSEVHAPWRISYGQKISELVFGTPGFWVDHSREDEQIGFCGPSVESIEPIVLDEDKTAVITKVGGVSIAGAHLTYMLKGTHVRVRQINVLLDRLKNEEKAVIMGDFNALPWQKPRKLIEKAGYQSVFSLLGIPRKPTTPTADYMKYLKPYERMLVGKGLPLDDIYIKGLEVESTGVLEADSDHLGIWAKIKI
jgi:hypothetical protein